MKIHTRSSVCTSICSFCLLKRRRCKNTDSSREEKKKKKKNRREKDEETRQNVKHTFPPMKFAVEKNCKNRSKNVEVKEVESE